MKIRNIIAFTAVLLMTACSDDNTPNPLCEGLECGPDGNGGSCGTCRDTEICIMGSCALFSDMCTPDCSNRECGNDGCGGSCGVCSNNLMCSPKGKCTASQEECIPQCKYRQCGDDGCGGVCGYCSGNAVCNQASGSCVCTPDCSNRQCGNDGCGGICGVCAENTMCSMPDGKCIPFGVSGKIILETQTVFYDDKQLPKFDKKVDIPGAGLPIAYYKNHDPFPLATTVTADDGSFHFELPDAPDPFDHIVIVPVWYVDDKPKLAIFVPRRKGDNSSLYNDLWEWDIQLNLYRKDNIYSTLDELKDIRITIEQASGGLYLYQTLVQAYEDLAAHGYGKTVAELPSMGVLWGPGFYWDCGSCFVNQSTFNLRVDMHDLDKTMYIEGRKDTESAWGYPTILHEFGHYTLFQRRDDSEGGLHYMNGLSEPKLAWSEGYATFYSLMAMSWRTGTPVTRYWRISENSRYWLDYAHLFDETGFGSIAAVKPDMHHPKGMKQDLNEAWISYILWNIFDGADVEDPSSPPDGIAIGSGGVFNATGSKRYMSCNSFNHMPPPATEYRTIYDTDFVDYLDAVICSGIENGKNDEVSKIIDYVIENGFPYDRNPVCSEN